MREIEDIHIPFLAWLEELKIPCIHHRPDRKSGIQTGWPDFTVMYDGRVVCIEAKTLQGRLTAEQGNVHREIRAAGNRVEVCRSLRECKEAVRNYVLHEGLCEAFSTKLSAAPVLADPDCKALSAGEARDESPERESTKVPPVGVSGQDSRGGAQFYIGDWKGVSHVFAPDQGGAFRMIRQASALDRIRLPKLPAGR